ncbi:hypothetical protein [Pseudomonas phage D6]|nr:hypothetical protein [Pseudomonas phage D6]
MNIKTWREARFVLVKDSLVAMATRLGFMNAEAINLTPVAVVNDGWYVRITATKGVGLQIRHTIEVEISQQQNRSDRYRFFVDVLGANQCKNCWFPIVHLQGTNGVNGLTQDQFEDICILPEIFADFVASEMLTHYNKG